MGDKSAEHQDFAAAAAAAAPPECEVAGRQQARPAARRDQTAPRLPGMGDVDLNRIVVPLEILPLIPEPLARQHQALVFIAERGRLCVALRPDAPVEVVHLLEAATGCQVVPYRAKGGDLAWVIDEAYRRHKAGETHYVGASVPPSQMPPLRLVRGDETGRITLPPPSWPAEGLETEPPVPLVGAPKPPSMSALDTPKTSSHRPPARARILIVDPQEDFRQLLRRVLEGKGYDAVEAHDGRAALEALEHTRVDLLLLDSHGPHMHGFELCQHLRASPQWHALPIIMVSALYRGWRFAADIEERYGVDAFLEKPFKVSDVVRAVRRALSDRGAATSASDEDQASIDPEAQSLLARSVEAYQRGQIDTAIELLRAGVGGHPTCFELHYHLALLFGRKDRLVDAIETLETAVELRPRDFSALKNLAILYQRAGFRHQAAEIWHRALLCAPDAATQEGIRAHLIQLF